jgi:hypothetical protein
LREVRGLLVIAVDERIIIAAKFFGTASIREALPMTFLSSDA